MGVYLGVTLFFEIKEKSIDMDARMVVVVVFFDDHADSCSKAIARFLQQ